MRQRTPAWGKGDAHGVRRRIRSPSAEEECVGVSAHGAQGRQGVARARRAQLRRDGRGRRADWEGHVIPAQREAEAERERRVLVHHVQVAQGSCPGQRKAMKGPRPTSMMNPKSMPFDGKRMIYGGFKAK